MSRPKNKEELLELSSGNFQKLLAFVHSFSEKEKLSEFPEGYLNRNIRDVLGHLHHWHLMMLKWYKTGMSGDKPDIPEKGYTWKTLPDLNKEIWKKYKEVALDTIVVELERSFLEVRKVIEKHSDKELFEKQFYNWTGTTSLGAYFISASSSHYDWAYKLIKKCKK